MLIHFSIRWAGELSTGKMVLVMKVNGLAVKLVAKENYFYQMETPMKVNGKMIKHLVLVVSYLKQNVTSENGRMMSIMVRERKSGKMDLVTLGHSPQVRRTDMEFTNGQIKLLMKVVG